MRDIPDKKPLPPFPPQIDEASLYAAGIYTPSWMHLRTILLRRRGSSISIRIYPIPPAGVQSFGLAYSAAVICAARNGRMQPSPTSFSTAATFPTHASQGFIYSGYT